MARPERRIDTTRQQQARLSQQTAAVTVAAASSAAAVAEQAQEAIDTAIAGDLIAASPSLFDKINEIEGRLDDLETP
jgi:hypothetical protein